MKRLFGCAALVLAALVLSSCFERKQTAMINPDGSGKMVIDTFIAPPDLGGAGGPKPDANEMARQFANGLISKSQGVDAWKDFKVEVAGDGRAHVIATAYFPDLSKFKLEGASPMKWSKDAKGNYTLTIAKQIAGKEPAAAPKLTDQEVADKLQKTKADYKQNQAVAQMILGTLKLEMTFTLPGPVLEANIFTKRTDNTVSLAIDGKKMLEAMDKMMADDKSLEESIRGGKEANQNDDLMLEKMFGKKGPISATVAGPGKALFDYKTEMEAAKAGQAEMLKQAGVAANKLDGTLPMPMEKAE